MVRLLTTFAGAYGLFRCFFGELRVREKSGVVESSLISFLSRVATTTKQKDDDIIAGLGL